MEKQSLGFIYGFRIKFKINKFIRNYFYKKVNYFDINLLRIIIMFYFYGVIFLRKMYFLQILFEGVFYIINLQSLES